MGAWITCGLGTESTDLPGYVTIDPISDLGGAGNYGSAFLPASYPGTCHGEAYPLGQARVDGKMDTHDLHATILHLLGLDHEALTYNFAGRDFRLTNGSGKGAKKILI